MSSNSKSHIPARYRKKPTLKVSTETAYKPISNLTVQNPAAADFEREEGPVSSSSTTRVDLQLDLPTQKVAISVCETEAVKEVIENIANIHRYELGSDPHGIVLWENIEKYNLRRPLRDKEFFKHILASWDTVYGNFLTVAPSQSRLDTNSLAFLNPRRDIARNPTLNITNNIYWKTPKCDWKQVAVDITPDGHLNVMKSSKQLCSLLINEFDVYEIYQKFKSPRKNVIAIRSQQNPNYFLDIADSVHYFSVENDKMFDKFKNTLFTMRSQLVDQLVRVYESQLSGDTGYNSSIGVGAAGLSSAETASSRSSLKLESPSSFSSGGVSPNQFFVAAGSTNISSTMANNNYPLQQGLLNLHANTIEDTAISPDGLLGRSYSSRKVQQQQQQQQQRMYRLQNQSVSRSADQIIKPNSLLANMERTKSQKSEYRRLPNSSIVVAHSGPITERMVQ